MLNQLSSILSSKKLFWVYCIFITLLVALPLNNIGASELNNITIIRLRGDYFFHVLLFMPWAFLSLSYKLNIWLWMVLGLAFATSSELLQYLLPYRSYNINDLVANNIGVILSVILYQSANIFDLLTKKN